MKNTLVALSEHKFRASSSMHSFSLCLGCSMPVSFFSMYHHCTHWFFASWSSSTFGCRVLVFKVQPTIIVVDTARTLWCFEPRMTPLTQGQWRKALQEACDVLNLEWLHLHKGNEGRVPNTVAHWGIRRLKGPQSFGLCESPLLRQGSPDLSFQTKPSQAAVAGIVETNASISWSAFPSEFEGAGAVCCWWWYVVREEEQLKIMRHLSNFSKAVVALLGSHGSWRVSLAAANCGNLKNVYGERVARQLGCNEHAIIVVLRGTTDNSRSFESREPIEHIFPATGVKIEAQDPWIPNACPFDLSSKPNPVSNDCTSIGSGLEKRRCRRRWGRRSRPKRICQRAPVRPCMTPRAVSSDDHFLVCFHPADDVKLVISWITHF